MLVGCCTCGARVVDIRSDISEVSSICWGGDDRSTHEPRGEETGLARPRRGCEEAGARSASRGVYPRAAALGVHDHAGPGGRLRSPHERNDPAGRRCVPAWIFAIAMEPAVSRLARRGWRRGAATGTVMVGLFLAIVAFFAIFGTIFVE